MAAPQVLRRVGGVGVDDGGVNRGAGPACGNAVRESTACASGASRPGDAPNLAAVHFEDRLQPEQRAARVRDPRDAAALPGVVERVQVCGEIDAGDHVADRGDDGVHVVTGVDGAACRRRDEALAAGGGLRVHDLDADAGALLGCSSSCRHAGRVVGGAEPMRYGERQHRLGLRGGGPERLQERRGRRRRGCRRLTGLPLETVELGGGHGASNAVFGAADVNAHRDDVRRKCPVSGGGQRGAAVDDDGHTVLRTHNGGEVYTTPWPRRRCGGARTVPEEAGRRSSSGYLLPERFSDLMGLATVPNASVKMSHSRIIDRIRSRPRAVIL